MPPLVFQGSHAFLAPGGLFGDASKPSQKTSTNTLFGGLPEGEDDGLFGMPKKTDKNPAVKKNAQETSFKKEAPATSVQKGTAPPLLDDPLGGLLAPPTAPKEDSLVLLLCSRDVYHKLLSDLKCVAGEAEADKERRTQTTRECRCIWGSSLHIGPNQRSLCGSHSTSSHFGHRCQ